MCEWGTDEIVKLAYPMEFSGRTSVAVDRCIAPLVQMLNDHGVHTLNSCCGHGISDGSIIYEQGGSLVQMVIRKTSQMTHDKDKSREDRSPHG